MKKIGIIGSTGRMGRFLQTIINNEQGYVLGACFHTKSDYSLKEVFIENDFIIDFSTAALITEILEAVKQIPKPLLICTTGWNKKEHEESIQYVSQQTPLFIDSNTSFGANAQRFLTAKLAEIINDSYDIDILEKHHRKKKDTPSGTAITLAEEIKNAKNNYTVQHLQNGARPNNIICMNAQRIGNAAGEHEVLFQSAEESISIKHTVFNAEIFAKGALQALKWLDTNKKTNGLYNMYNTIFNL